LQVRLTARTPLLIGGFSRRDGDGQEAPDVPRRADGTPMVPGSGLLGAVRSVHEALAGGCLRVFDTERVPVHRHPANTSVTQDLRMAIVLDVNEEGRATRVALCDRWIWIHKDLLPGDADRLSCTGDRLRVPEDAAVDSGNRKVLLPRTEKNPGGVSPESVARVSEMDARLADSWVLLVTDTGARSAKMPMYFAAGKAGPDAVRCEIPPDTWELYQEVVAGSNDLRPARLRAAGHADGKEPAWGSRPPEYEDVKWPPQPDDSADGQQVIARRLMARSYLHRGQPAWVRLDGRSVTEIRLSQLWRYRGAHPAGDRAGDAVPCPRPDTGDLCWSCRVFGSADTSGRDPDDIAAQRSYRGHVRFDDLVAEAGFEPVAWHLAPLSAPRPSAGQFYLDHTAVPDRRRRAAKDTAPAATWGSCADEGGARPIRGRKFYWRTTGPDKGEHPRGERRHQSDTQTRDVALVPAGAVFAGRVCFDNLSLEDYGSLLAALDPRRLNSVDSLDWGGVVTSVGGGKPFGFGAVSIEVTPERVQTAPGRYLGRAEDVPAAADAVRAFRAQVPQPVSATWRAMRNVLTFGFIADDLVWYPPGSGIKGDAAFDRSFEFFSHTTGLKLKDKVRDLVLLPAADGPPHSQVLDSGAGERAVDPSEDSGRGERRPGRAGPGSRRRA